MIVHRFDLAQGTVRACRASETGMQHFLESAVVAALRKLGDAGEGDGR